MKKLLVSIMAGISVLTITMQVKAGSTVICHATDKMTWVKFDQSGLNSVEAIEDGADYNTAYGTPSKTKVSIEEIMGVIEVISAKNLYGFRLGDTVELGSLYDVKRNQSTGQFRLIFNVKSRTGTFELSGEKFTIKNCQNL